MLAPVPTEKEVADNLAWSSPLAEIFFECMCACTHLGPSDFLIMPAIFGLPARKKVSAAELVMSKAIFKAASSSLTIKGFVCIGSDPFRFLVGDGRCPSMSTLGGAVLRAPQTGNKPMVIVPDLDPLWFSPDGLSRRDLAIAQQQQRAVLRSLESTAVFRKIKDLFK